jgi:two-component sensor histidine kinase
LVLHEQATNAVKYGALSTDDGHVTITGRCQADMYLITWQERNGPPVNGPPERKGFGTQMAARSVAGQLGGKLDYDWAPEGLTLQVIVPAANLLL